MPNPVAAIPAVASVGSAALSSRSAKKAAKSQEKAAQAGSQAVLEQYYQSREDMMPWRDAGYAALNQQMQLLGLPPVSRPVSSDQFSVSMLSPDQRAQYDSWMSARPQRRANRFTGPKGAALASLLARGDDVSFSNWASQAPDFLNVDNQGNVVSYLPSGGNVIDNDSGQVMNPTEILRNTPGYQFQMEEGLKALDRSASARGRLFSGAQLKALTRFGQGMADASFSDYFNRLGVIAGTGQTANSNMAALGANAVGQANQLGMMGAQAQAGNAINQANIGTNLLNNFTDIYAARNFNRPTGGYRPTGMGDIYTFGNGGYFDLGT